MLAIGIAVRHIWQAVARLYLEKGQISFWIPANDFCLVFAPVRERDRNFMSAIYDMIVRRDIARRINYETGAQCALVSQSIAAPIEIVPEHFAERRR